MQQDNFYEQLASTYDDMTRFSDRLVGERRRLEFWAQNDRWQNAIDAACGTGLHAVALASLGIRTLATDASAAMLEQARNNARTHGVAIEFRHLRLQDHGCLEGGANAVLCLGNSLPHLLNRDELVQALRGFHRNLRPGGRLLLQLLNYDRILSRRERLVGMTGQENRDFLRYYTFLDPLLRFSIVTVDRRSAPVKTALQETLLYPYTRSELEKALIETGFCDPVFYADLERSPWSAETSRDTVCSALRPNEPVDPTGVNR